MREKSLESLFRLDGKVIIITGAAGLLGQQHAEAIAHFGGTPVLLDLYEKPVKQLADELNEKYSVSALGICLDITSEEAIFNNCNQLIKIFGKIDGLVNNAANNPKVEEKVEKNFLG